jgi:hypothetical protein
MSAANSGCLELHVFLLELQLLLLHLDKQGLCSAAAPAAGLLGLGSAGNRLLGSLRHHV